jgi:predicted metal-dependent peptidase
MHFFVSDLHITDADIAGVVSDAELTAFVDRLGRIAGEKNRRLTLVFGTAQVIESIEVARSLIKETIMRGAG